MQYETAEWGRMGRGEGIFGGQRELQTEQNHDFSRRRVVGTDTDNDGHEQATDPVQWILMASILPIAITISVLVCATDCIAVGCKLSSGTPPRSGCIPSTSVSIACLPCLMQAVWLGCRRTGRARRQEPAMLFAFSNVYG